MHREKVVKKLKNWRGQFIPGNIFFSHTGDIRFLFHFCTQYDYLYKYIEIRFN